MPKPTSLIPSRIIEAKLPIELLDAVDARLYDPVLGRVAYGARVALIHRLLAEWAERTPVSPKAEAAIASASPRPPTMSLEQLLAATPRS